MCAHARVHICRCACTHVCTCVWMCARMCTCARACACVRACSYARVHVCLCVDCVCSCARVCAAGGTGRSVGAGRDLQHFLLRVYAVCCFVPLSLKHDSVFPKEQDGAGRSWSCSHSAMCPEPITLAQPGCDHCRAGRKLPMAIKQPCRIQGASAALQSASDASFEKPSLTAPPTVTSASRSPLTWLYFLRSVSRHLKLRC